MSKTTLVDTKSLLAKLLATENITVRHLDVKTAMFDVKNRILTCPIWKDMDGFLYDLVMGHEVGHALYTPGDKFIAYNELHMLKRFGYIMTVEDARIEKKIKRTYPGLRRSFLSGYKSLLERDFFGINGLNGDTSKLNLIDRINLHCKVGTQIVIKFTSEEREYVKKVENLETWEEAVKVADEIYDYVKKNEKDKICNADQLKELIKAIKEGKIQKSDASDMPGESIDIPPEMMNDVEDGEEDSSSSDGDESDEDGDSEETDEKSGSGKGEKSDQKEDDKSSGKKSGSKNTEPDKEGEKKVPSKNKSSSGKNNDLDKSDQKEEVDSQTGKEGGVGGTPQNDIEPESITNDSFRQREEELLDTNARPYIFLDIPECDLSKTIVPIRKTLEAFENDLKASIRSHNGAYLSHTQKVPEYESLSTQVFSIFHAKNTRYISLLVKEFEMRKNAQQYARQLESKSGELDMRSLAKYRFTNDIFRKMTEVLKGKNHGMIMFVDMSASMVGIFRNTLEQTVVLALFCKKVGIPFQVYGFSDNAVQFGKYGIDTTYTQKKFTPKTVSAFDLPNSNFHLKELLNSELNVREFKRAACMLITLAAMYGRAYGGDAEIDKIFNNFNSCSNSGQMGLSGTPFMETLVASKQIINNFKKATHVDIVNVVYLTDGEGNHSMMLPNSYRLDKSYSNANIGIVDPVTKKRVMVKPSDVVGNPTQAALTRLIRETTDCRHIGFYIGDRNTIHGILKNLSKKVVPEKKQDMEKSFKEESFFSCPNLGYDSYYYLAIKSTAVEDEKMKLYSFATKSEILAEFTKVQEKKHSNRALVSSFASEIAA